jgi:hypothetical protein
MMRSLSLRMRDATASSRGSAAALAAALLAAERALLAVLRAFAPLAEARLAVLDAARLGVLAVRLEPDPAPRAEVDRLAVAPPELVRLAAVDPPPLALFAVDDRGVVRLAPEDELARLLRGFELEPELDEPPDVDPALLLGWGMFPPWWT